MKNYIKRFEMFVLRPIWVVTLVVGVVSLFRESWWCLIGCALGLLCIALVGQALHPLQTGHELSQGPLEGQGAIREATMLIQEDQLALVREACTRVGILISFALFVVLLMVAHWHWYWAALLTFFGSANIVALLRVVFCAI